MNKRKQEKQFKVKRWEKRIGRASIRFCNVADEVTIATTDGLVQKIQAEPNLSKETLLVENLKGMPKKDIVCYAKYINRLYHEKQKRHFLFCFYLESSNVANSIQVEEKNSWLTMVKFYRRDLYN